jgi:hypothetical protein
MTNLTNLTVEEQALISDMNERLKRLEDIIADRMSPCIAEEIVQPIDTTDGEQEQGKKWKPKVGEWFKSKFGHLYLCYKLESGQIFGENQDGMYYAIDYYFPTTQPTPEEIQAHLVEIAQKKYPVGAKVKCLSGIDTLDVIPEDFQYCYASCCA